MKKTAFFLFAFWATAFAQNIPSPESFLGYPLGSQFTRHHMIVDYVEEVAAQSPHVQLQRYGSTNEGRPLLLAMISSPENLASLEEIRQNNLRAVGFEEGEVSGKRLPIVWLSYNIHGNEASSSEAAMRTLYELTTNDTANWLDEALIIMDPCVNPDGRDRYVNWFRQAANNTPNVLSESWEHVEPWPGGRVNHYLFDLNRDWCWQTQMESQQRAKMYHQWMPQIHVDYHEQGVNSPYYFGPAAEPFHEVITDWQREFQRQTGKNHARYFDREGWLYFTREIFDLFYPSYGDTWPTFQGAIGFTYEQAGHGTSGRAVLKQNGDTLSLLDRLTHHFTTGLSTIEVAVKKKEELLKNFDEYFSKAQNNPEGPYQSYLISHTNPPHKIASFLELMDKNFIEYGHPRIGSRKYAAYDYQKHQRNTINISEKDILIPLKQSQANLVRVLLDPESKLADSLTYDLTAWSLPYAFDLQAYALEDELELRNEPLAPEPKPEYMAEPEPYGYALNWEDFGSAIFLSKALQEGFKARYTNVPTKIGYVELKEGSLIFLKADNREKSMKELLNLKGVKQNLLPIYTGFSDMGKDLGSGTFDLIKKPKIAVVGGRGIGANSFGEVWHYFEQDLQFPITVIPAFNLNRAPLSKYDVLVMPSGNYRDYASAIQRFLQSGGRVIALERAMSVFAQNGPDVILKTKLAQALEEKKKANGEGTNKALQPYGDRERNGISDFTAGSIYALKLDPTHPLSFGLGEQIHIIKRNSRVYPYMKEGFQVGILESGTPVSGFTGKRLQSKLKETFVWGAERMGRGKIIYFTDSPVFRGFWYTGKLALANSLFLW